jgi:D-3-phosphoglycerate dehydrogenase
MNVLFLDVVHPILEQRLTLNGFTCIDGTEFNEEQLKKMLFHCQGIVVRSRMNLDESVLKYAPNLRFIARSGAGMETIDVAYCEQQGIQLINAPEGNKNAVAEHALGMLLALFNKLKQTDTEVRQGIWKREANRGLEIAGKTIGIIGYGNNGSQFAKLLSGFDCTILAYDKYKKGFGTERIQEVDLPVIFQKADVVSFHIPQTEETLFMGNISFFNQFQKAIYLINLSRGKIVQLEAIAGALKGKKITGACLDVLELENKKFEEAFANELLPEAVQFLLQQENVLFSPHVGGWTTESYFKLSNVLADKILRTFSH